MRKVRHKIRRMQIPLVILRRSIWRRLMGRRFYRIYRSSMRHVRGRRTFGV